MVGFFDEVDPGKCGGKGKNLIKLIENRFPVPQGFIVTVEAYSLFKTEMRVPESVAQAITACYRKLVAQSGITKVAVRSSATVEDSASASFAGLFDTYLNIDGTSGVLEHVVECWRSQHSERSTLYRKMMNLTDEDLAMAVVVQTMLAPRSAGVIFTANPYTMDKNVMIVESSRGCGEKVVSGTITPDYFEIMKNKSFDIVKKMRGSEASGNGKAEDAGENNPAAAYSIEDDALQQLCLLAQEIELAFGRPQDIEWAMHDDCSFSILQSRPLARFEQNS